MSYKKKDKVQMPSAIKKRLKEHLASKDFKDAFEAMVLQTRLEGREYAFGVELRVPKTGIVRFRATTIYGGVSPNATREEGDVSTPRKISIGGCDDAEYELLILNEFGHSGLFSRILSFHTHPYSRYDPKGAFIPSEVDVEGICKHGICVGLIVPVDIDTGKISIIAYQPLSSLSHVAYESLLYEIMEGNGSDDLVLKEAAKRGILQVCRFGERDSPEFSKRDIGRLLRLSMEYHLIDLDLVATESLRFRPSS